MQQKAIIPKDYAINLNQEDLQLLMCTICYGIVNNPVQCTNCERLYCNQHAINWKKQKNSCPSCRDKPWIVKERIHRVLRGTLQKTNLRCKCGQVFGYIQFLSHPFQSHANESRESQKPKKKQQKAIEGTNKIQKKQQKSMIQGNKKIEKKQQKAMIQGNKKIEKKQQKISKFLFLYHDGFWLSFSPKLNEKLNKSLFNNNFKFDLIDEKQVKYSFDLINLKANNLYFDLNLRALVFEQEYIWRCLCEENSTYFFYLKQINKRIQQLYQKFLSDKTIKCVIYLNKKKYEINYQKMIQKNLQTNFQRKIIRTIY